MSYRLACDASGIGSLRSSSRRRELARSRLPSGRTPVAMLQIHGTADDTIAFTGGSIDGHPYPAAEESVAIWATYDGCRRPVIGRSTGRRRCRSDRRGAAGRDDGEALVRLQARRGGRAVDNPGRQPRSTISSAFGGAVLDFLEAHPEAVGRGASFRHRAGTLSPPPARRIRSSSRRRRLLGRPSPRMAMMPGAISRMTGGGLLST